MSHQEQYIKLYISKKYNTLTSNAKVLYQLMLANRNNKTSIAFISTKKIMVKMKRNRDSIYRYMKELKANNFIHQSYNQNKPCYFVVNSLFFLKKNEKRHWIKSYINLYLSKNITHTAISAHNMFLFLKKFGESYVSCGLKEIRKLLHISPRTIGRCTHLLAKNSLIIDTGRKTNRKTIYQVFLPCKIDNDPSKTYSKYLDSWKQCKKKTLTEIKIKTLKAYNQFVCFSRLLRNINKKTYAKTKSYLTSLSSCIKNFKLKYLNLFVSLDENRFTKQDCSAPLSYEEVNLLTRNITDSSALRLILDERYHSTFYYKHKNGLLYSICYNRINSMALT